MENKTFEEEQVDLFTIHTGSSSLFTQSFQHCLFTKRNPDTCSHSIDGMSETKEIESVPAQTNGKTEEEDVDVEEKENQVDQAEEEEVAEGTDTKEDAKEGSQAAEETPKRRSKLANFKKSIKKALGIKSRKSLNITTKDQQVVAEKASSSNATDCADITLEDKPACHPEEQDENDTTPSAENAENTPSEHAEAATGHETEANEAENVETKTEEGSAEKSDAEIKEESDCAEKSDPEPAKDDDEKEVSAAENCENPSSSD